MSAPTSHEPVVALVGNPNVGKSTLFNALTHLHQHTGNWPGKTVDSAAGTYTYRNRTYTLIDLPGTYSLHPGSAEEEVTRDYLLSGQADTTLVVADATCLQRNLALVLQVLEVTWPVVVCVNLLDEAAKKHITVDLAKLEQALGCPVVGTAARSGSGLDRLCAQLEKVIQAPPPRPEAPSCAVCPQRDESCQQAAFITRAARLAQSVTIWDPRAAHRRDRLLDRFFTSKATGMAAMLLLFTGILWLTVVGANVPSQLLSRFLFSLLEPFHSLFQHFALPRWLEGAVVDGICRTVFWVVSVMLPPMAIFFPLFTLLEDMGYLPRAAFNLDHFFRRSGAHGRQALTMCMALGCNACGVMGCRIIQSDRERLLAILTNAFIPCNGRFPTLIALISMFFTLGAGRGGAALSCAMLLAAIVLAVIMTLWVNRLLTATVLKGETSFFSLELPPYRMPRVGQVLIRSALDRTLFVLGRAVAVAAPAGLLIWLGGNIRWGGESILAHLSRFLQPAGVLLGVDGMVLLALLMAFPAGEIFLPCLLMGYLSTGVLTDYGSLTQLHSILLSNGWTASTALATVVLMLFHFPCGTTCLTIWRETKSLRWTALAILLPAAVGVLLCLILRPMGLLL